MEQLYFKIHTPNLLKEIVECAIPRNAGMLKVPLNELRRRLWELAELAQEIKDPRLSLWCYEMTLFEEANPASEYYNPKVPEILEKQIKEIRRK